MNCGLIRAYGALDIGGLFTASGSASGTGVDVQCSGSSTTYWDPDGASFGPGIEIQFKSTFPSSGAGSSLVELTIPALSYSSTVTFSTAQTSIESHVRFTNLSLYITEVAGVFMWALTWSALDWYVNGSIQHSFGAAPFASAFTSSRIAPSGVPLIGIPATIAAGVAPPPVPAPVGSECPATIISTIPTGDSGSGTASVTNGWRFQEPGTSSWQAPPVDISILGISAGGCAPGLGSSASGSDTWAASVSASGSSSVSYSEGAAVTCHCPPGEEEFRPGILQTVNATAVESTQSGSLCLVPNLPKTVKRLNYDFAEMVLREALPSATRTASSTWSDPSTGASGSNSTSDQPFPSAAQILSVVGNAPHPLENPLFLPTLAPYRVGASHSTYTFQEFIVIQTMICGEPPGPPPPEPPCPTAVCDACSGATGSALTGADGNGGAAYLGSGNSLEQYIDFLACPLWSCFVWFPLDSDTSSGSSWPLDGSPAPPSSYWMKARTQWLHNALLPSAEERKTRTDLVSAPLLDGALNPLVYSIFGQRTSWWGISRFAVDNLSLPSSVALDSAEAAGWAFASCTAAFGASIALTPTGSPDAISATYDLGEFATDPRMLPHLAAAIVVGWSGAGVATASVDLVGTDGSICHLASEPGTNDWPTGTTGSKYAGSWGQDFTVGFASSDSGADALATGISTAEMADVEHVHAFELPYGETAASLRFTFQISSAAEVTLNYPTFNLPSAAPTLIPETGFTDAVLYPNTSGIRFGQWKFYSSGAWLSPPSIRAFGSKSSTLDYLGWANLLYRGVDSQSNVLSVLGTLYDANEGQTEALAAADTISFLTLANGGITGVMCNTWREVPPLCCFPMPSRGRNLQPAVGCDTSAYSATQEGRCYPTAGPTPLVLSDPGGSVWTAAQVAPAGWSLSRHAHAVTNAEDSGFRLSRGSITYANASPWHGYFSVLFPGGCVSPDSFQSRAGELHVVCVSGGNLRYQWAPFPTGPIAFDVPVTTDGGWTEPCIHMDHRGRIELRATQGGHVFRMVSDDNGRTWGPVVGGVLSPALVI